MRTARRETIAVTLAVLLVAAAFVVPHLHLGIVTPLINSTPKQIHMFADTAPIFGWWNAHVGWGTVPAIVIGAAAVLWGPELAQRLRWRSLTLAAWATSAAWAFSLAMIDGWHRGFAGRLTAQHEYLRQVPTITDIPEALRTFAGRILDFQPNSWITHVSGHPPGALLTFVWLDRIGLGGGAWAALLCPGDRVERRRRGPGDGARARRRDRPPAWRRRLSRWHRPRSGSRCRPTAISPVSPRGAWRCSRWPSGGVRHPGLAAAGAGLLLGWAIFLNYGLALMALPAVAVLAVRRDRSGRAGAGGGRRAGRAGRGRGVRGRRFLVVRRISRWSSNAIGRASR